MLPGLEFSLCSCHDAVIISLGAKILFFQLLLAEEVVLDDSFSFLTYLLESRISRRIHLLDI